jgi:hypothetical protein
MSILFTRIDVGAPERNRLVGRALEEVRTPPDEDWLGHLVARGSGTWEILLSGPRREDSEGWAATEIGGDRAQYRCCLPPDLQSADIVRRVVRALLWKRVTVFVAQASGIGSQLEEALWDVLTRAPLPGAEAHAAPWPSSHGATRWAVTVEKVERGTPPELLWCGVVHTANEASRELSAALGIATPAPTPQEPLSFLVPDGDERVDTSTLFMGVVPTLAAAP